MNTTAMTVYSLIAAGALHYVRATSMAQARVRAYKVWGCQPAKITPVGNWAPETVGKFGYGQWVREDEKQARAEYYPPAADEAEKVAPDAKEIARLMALIGMK